MKDAHAQSHTLHICEFRLNKSKRTCEFKHNVLSCALCMLTIQLIVYFTVYRNELDSLGLLTQDGSCNWNNFKFWSHRIVYF